MAEAKTTKSTRTSTAKKAPAKKATTARKTPAKKAPAKRVAAKKTAAPKTEARSRFNAALEEAKAGAEKLRTQAGEHASTAREQAMSRGGDLMEDAKVYSCLLYTSDAADE